MNRIHRAQTVIMNRAFQSRWMSLSRTSADWRWPVPFPLSWAGQSSYANWLEWEDNLTSLVAGSYKGYKEAIKRYIKRTDDIPVPGDDARMLRIGVHFPKTRHGIFLRLSDIKADLSMEDRKNFETSESRERLLYEFIDYRNKLKLKS